MDNIKIFDYNYWDSQSIQSSSEAVNFPDTNTQERWKITPWRSTGVASEYVQTTGGSSIESCGFFLFQHNLTASATVLLVGSNDNWSTTPLSVPMVRAANQYVYIPASPLTYDDYGFSFADVGNPDGYLEIGRIWLGDCYVPTPGYNPEIMERQIDPSIVIESDGGQVSILEKLKYKTWTIPFDAIMDKSRYDVFIDRIGLSKPFVMLRKPKNHYLSTYPNPEIYSYYVHLKAHTESPLAGNIFKAILNVQEER